MKQRIVKKNCGIGESLSVLSEHQGPRVEGNAEEMNGPRFTGIDENRSVTSDEGERRIGFNYDLHCAERGQVVDDPLIGQLLGELNAMKISHQFLVVEQGEDVHVVSVDRTKVLP